MSTLGVNRLTSKSKIAVAAVFYVRHSLTCSSIKKDIARSKKWCSSVSSMKAGPSGQAKGARVTTSHDDMVYTKVSKRRHLVSSVYVKRSDSETTQRTFSSASISCETSDLDIEVDAHNKPNYCFDNLQVKWNPKGSLTIEWPGSCFDIDSDSSSTITTEYPYRWLKDHCRCPQCFNTPTSQRQVDTFQVTGTKPDEIPTKIDISSNYSLELHFPSHTTSYPLSWLQHHNLPAPSNKTASAVSFRYHNIIFDSRKTLWNSQTLKLPLVSYDDYMNEEEAEIQALKGLQEYGLLLVKSTLIESMDPTEAFGKKLGHFILPTLYGTMWSTHASRQDNQSVHDTAYGSDTLECHTDCTYMRDPPGIQIFTCAKAASKGGANRFVDGFDVVRQLSNEAVSFFASHAVPFGCNDDGFHLHTEFPMIQGYSTNEDTFLVDHFRHNDYDRRPLVHWDSDTVEQFYSFQNELVSLIRQADQEVKVVLQEGDMIVVDNHRVMHGRYGFEGTRILLGCYLNRDCVDSRIRTMTKCDESIH